MEIKDLENCPVSLELELQAAVKSIIAGNWWDIVAGESDVSEPELTRSGDDLTNLAHATYGNDRDFTTLEIMAESIEPT